MPDWISHILFGLIICEIEGIKKKRSLVVLGALLPDVLSKMHLSGYFFSFNWEIFYVLFQPASHSIVGAILLSLIASGLFIYDQKMSFLLLGIGALSHLLADLSIRFFLYGPMHMLLPFSFRSTYLGWFWSDEYLYPILIFLVVYLVIKLIKLKLMKKVKKHESI